MAACNAEVREEPASADGGKAADATKPNVRDAWTDAGTADAAMDAMKDGPKDGGAGEAVGDADDATSSAHDASSWNPDATPDVTSDSMAPPDSPPCTPDAATGFASGVGGRCVQVLAEGYSIGAIAIDHENLYWAATTAPLGDGGSNENMLLRTPLGGGAGSTVASGDFVLAIELDSANVYWTSESVDGLEMGSTLQAPLAGGVIVTIESSVGVREAIAVDSTSVYWTTQDSSGGAVVRATINGGNIVTLSSQAPPVDEFNTLKVSGQSAFWVLEDSYPGPGAILSVPISGGATTSLFTGITAEGCVAVDANSIYWIGDSMVGTVDMSGMLTVSRSGGAPETTVSGLGLGGYPTSMAIDEQSVYWVDFDSNTPPTGSLRKISLAGGSVTTLATGLGYAENLRVDATSVYWVGGDSEGNAILRLTPK
jgi:hypothetical protein